MAWAGRTTYSQYGEDVIMAEFLKEESGGYIDIGAGHPTQGSNTYGLYLRGWRGLLVEPLARFQPDIQRLRPEDSLRQALVGESPGANAKFFEYKTWQFSTASKSRVDELAARQIHPTESYDVPVLSLADIAPKVSPDMPFVLNIDAEGWDYKILQGGDWLSFSPRLVVVEELDSPLRTPTPTFELLTSVGYYLQSYAYRSSFYVHSSTKGRWT